MRTAKTTFKLLGPIWAAATAGCVVYAEPPATGRPPPNGPNARTDYSIRAGAPQPGRPGAQPAVASSRVPASAERPGLTVAPAVAPAVVPAVDVRVPAQAPAGDRHGIDVESAAAQPTLELPPESTGRPEQLPAGAAAGRPAGFKPGAPAGYWIWQGPRGAWLLRTTTGNVPRLFRGHFAAQDDDIVDVSPLRTEIRDRIRRTPNGWAFSFLTGTYADGFTFTTREEGCVRFDLQLESGAQRLRAYVGHGEVEPRSGHFVVCPAGQASRDTRAPRR